MRLGCAAYSYRHDFKSGALTLEGFVDLCAGLRLDGVELTSYYFSDTSPERLHSLKRHCFLRGLHILATAVGSNFTQIDPSARQASVEMTRAWIDHSVTLGAPCIRVFAGPIPDGVGEDQAMAWAVDCLRECVAYGAKCGVVVALENHGGVTSTATQVRHMTDQLASPWFGLNLDLGNFKVNPYQEIAAVAPLAVTAHAKVSIRQQSGESEPVDYPRVAAILDAAGYQGYLSVEFEEEEPASTGVPEFVRRLRSVFPG